MELIIIVKKNHAVYHNYWTKDYLRLKSITTKNSLGLRLEQANRHHEKIRIYDPDRKLCLESTIVRTEDLEGKWYVEFDHLSQIYSSQPPTLFEQGTIGADIEGDRVLKFYS